ncbi:MAG: nucleotidyltransferase domain-containing protein [Planctomycetota bacterium]
MVHRSEFERIKRVVAQIADSNGARQAIVFGSYARGTATRHSDLDVLIIEDTSLPFLKRIDRYFDPLVERLGLAMDVLVYTPEEMETIKHRPFIQAALKEGIVVYESRTRRRSARASPESPASRNPARSSPPR